MSDRVILELSGVRKHYTIGANVIEVLRGIDLQVCAGEWLSLTGASGSGKTTLLHLLGLLERPDGGRITACGQDYSLLKRRAAADFRRKKLGFIFQNYCLLPELTVLENIQLPGMLAGMNRRQLEKDARELAERVGLQNRLEHRSPELSGGEQQRAAIARTLISNTPIMIFDDSLSAVDTETDAQIRKAIEKRFGKASVILISHRITTLSAADKIIVLDRGRIAEEGTHDSLKSAGGIYQKIYEAQSGIGEVNA